MLLLDAYALISLLGNEPAAAEVSDLIASRNDVTITSVNLAESVDHLGRVRGLVLRDIEGALRVLVGDGLTIRPVRERDAWRAADLRRKHYKKRSSEVSLADCFLLAAASGSNPIATADPPLASAARLEGIPVLALPDTMGKRP
jgi:predicted nucleic acid-binding protein